MKIELEMSLTDMVRAVDALRDAMPRGGEGYDALNGVRATLLRKLEEVERVYSEASIVLTEDEKSAARMGNRIEAIRALRARTNVSLRAAKEAVDRTVPFGAVQ